MEKTIVVFRKFKDSGSIIALFPHEKDGHYCECYMRIGQHSNADYSHCIKITRPATKEEFTKLARELESIGYNLDVRVRK
jgi:hypothetical protein